MKSSSELNSEVIIECQDVRRLQVANDVGQLRIIGGNVRYIGCWIWTMNCRVVPILDSIPYNLTTGDEDGGVVGFMKQFLLCLIRELLHTSRNPLDILDRL